MAINLEKNKESILSAWREVLDDKTATDWALFSYEGQTNVLKVVGKGSGGIEELRDDLNTCKIMYAFCRVLDPKTSLHKFVFIIWTGEAAPNLRKGTCASHIRDVCNLLKGAQVTISARNEEEVDPESIIEKVSKASGSAYSFKERGETIKPSGPVGTTYKRVIPQQEIDARERDMFWQKEEEEEKKRQEEERKLKEETRRKLELERQEREVKEAALREARIQERNNSITLQREAEKVKAIDAISKSVEIEDDRESEEMERKNRSEELRQQRSKEAQALISKRTIDARAVFEHNTSAGQLYQKKSYQSSNTSSLSENKRWPPQVVKADNANEESMASNVSQNQVNVDPLSAVAHNTITDNTNINETVTTSSVEDPVQTLVESPTNGATLLDPESDLGLRAEALYDYQAADDTEISFDPGDIITHIDQIDAGWWQGLDPQGNFGLFPANYVQLL